MVVVVVEGQVGLGIYFGGLVDATATRILQGVRLVNAIFSCLS
jgi:hypothetical protein